MVRKDIIGSLGGIGLTVVKGKYYMLRLLEFNISIIAMEQNVLHQLEISNSGHVS
jgi:hypothetical protein